MFLVVCLLTASCVQALGQQTTCSDTPLIGAIHSRDVGLAVRLIRGSTDLNAEPCGVSALAEAIIYDNSRVVEELLAHEADPNVLDSTRVSPLMAAAFYCRESFVPLLLAHGAKVNSLDALGYTALMWSTQNCENGAIAALLLHNGAQVNLKAKDGATALTVAAFYGNEDAVHVLVAAGADLVPEWGEEGNAISIARDRQVGRKSSHDRIYNYLLEVSRSDDAPNKSGRH